MLAIPEGFLYIPQFFSPAESDEMFHELRAGLDWKHQSIMMFGREVMQPRLTAWYADEGVNYTYSGRLHQAVRWHPLLDRLRHQFAEHFNISLNSVLANKYRNGQDSMGWHSDDEPELGPQPNIVSLSLGVKRRFLLRHRQDIKTKHELAAEHGSVWLMFGNSQRDYQHAVPKELRVEGERINLTFRWVENQKNK